MRISDWSSDVCSSDLLTPFETKRAKARIDVVGLILLVVSVGAFQIMLDTGREHDWFGSVWIVGLAVVAAISFAAFVIWELTDANPVVNLRIFRFRGFSFATMAIRSEEHTSELQSLMRISYAVFCLKKKNNIRHKTKTTNIDIVSTRLIPNHMYYIQYRELIT